MRKWKKGKHNKKTGRRKKLIQEQREIKDKKHRDRKIEKKQE